MSWFKRKRVKATYVPSDGIVYVTDTLDGFTRKVVPEDPSKGQEVANGYCAQQYDTLMWLNMARPRHYRILPAKVSATDTYTGERSFWCQPVATYFWFINNDAYFEWAGDEYRVAQCELVSAR